MNKPMITSPSRTTAEQDSRKPAYKGLYLVSRTDRPAASAAPTKPTQGLSLAPNRASGAPAPDEMLEARSAESIRMKLAACFGAILTAPLVWGLHTLVLSLHTR